MFIEFNIGLDNPITNAPNSVESTLEALHTHGVVVMDWRVAQSQTEQTVVGSAHTAWNEAKLHALSVALGQDCIAVKDGNNIGHLIGPKADAWGPFNPAYWINP